MKKLLVLITLVITVFTGCKEKEDSSTNKPRITKNFSAKIDGVLFQADAFFSKRTDPFISHNIIAHSSKTNGKEISFSLSFWGDTLGTYFFEDSAPTTCQGFYSEDATISTGTFLALTGSITVTKIDSIHKTLSGTFNFMANDFGEEQWRTITEGRFNNIPIFE